MDLGSGKKSSGIPDPWVKKASDTGIGSATLKKVVIWRLPFLEYFLHFFSCRWYIIFPIGQLPVDFLVFNLDSDLLFTVSFKISRRLISNNGI
jgi:hypothetical protein